VNWFNLAVEAGLMDEKWLAELKAEGNEMLSMVVSSTKTGRPRK